MEALAELRYRNGGQRMCASNSMHEETGGVYFEICKKSSSARSLNTFKKRLGDTAGAVRQANFGRAEMPVKSTCT